MGALTTTLCRKFSENYIISDQRQVSVPYVKKLNSCCMEAASYFIDTKTFVFSTLLLSDNAYIKNTLDNILELNKFAEVSQVD